MNKEKQWWIKFETRLWHSDTGIGFCSLATRGFWLELLCAMHLQGAYEITGSYEQIARIGRCETSEAAKAIVELKAQKVADVTLGHGNVTVRSRRFYREHKARENSRLRKQRERGAEDVTPESRDRVISKKQEVISKEEEQDAASPLVGEIQDEMTENPWDWPISDLIASFPNVQFTPAQIGDIEAEVKNTPVDREAWTNTITLYRRNHAPPKTWMPNRVGTLLNVFKDQKAKVERNGANSISGRSTKRTDQDVIAESADFYREWEERERSLVN